MSLNTNQRRLKAIGAICFSAVLLGVVLIPGCASSEEASQAENYDQAALSSFVGDKKPEASAAQNQMEELQAENTSLKQKIIKLERDNRSAMERITDAEAKLAAEREKSERAVEAARTAARSAAGMEPAKSAVSSTIPMSSYEDALAAFTGKKYDAAISLFEKLLAGGTGDDLADNCHYWIGESYFGKRNYNESIKHFDTVFSYKGSEKAGDAQFMIARSYEQLGKKAEAKVAYEKVVKDYPTSNKVAKAKARLSKM